MRNHEALAVPIAHSLSPALTVPPQAELPRPRARSIALLVLVWLVLHLGCLFTPGLLDDVDSIYIETAREMLVRHDFVTPYVDGIRFFDKPPLIYWMAAAGMKVFGPFDWAARLPLSLCVLGLFLAVYALGKRLFGERGGLYSALAIATSLGPYLFTRFYIPDILNALWMTLGVHLFLIALDRVRAQRSTAVAAWSFAAAMALNLLTKGLIGIVFPLAFVLLYAALTRQKAALLRMHPISSSALFFAIALPWHVLASLRNPAIGMPAGLGLPARAGWAWFYLVNEHVMRFRGLRIPHDYGNLPIPIFWLMFFLWLMPWSVFLPAALAQYGRIWRNRLVETSMRKQAALALVLWSGTVLLFFTVSSRQEYYSLPALPALALMTGGVLAEAELGDTRMRRHLLASVKWCLLPLALAIAIVSGVLGFISPAASPGADISDLLTTNPDQYNLALGHLHDLTLHAMGFFRAPLLCLAASMLAVGPASWLVRRRGRDLAANLTLAAGMCGVLLCVHSGLARFYPILGSKGLALATARAMQQGDTLLLDGELTSGSTLLFYTRHPVLLVNGRINGPWFGSFWPDAPDLFPDEEALRHLWAGPGRVFLLTYGHTREQDLRRFAPVHTLASAGGKEILSNR